MKKLLVFSDLDGTIDEADTQEFINLFDLIGKYCEKKGYDVFSFHIVTGAGERITEEYYRMLFHVKKKIGKETEFSIFSGLLPGEKKAVIDSVVGCKALPKGYDVPDDVDDVIVKEVIYFDDYPHKSLNNDAGKNYFESKYDIEYQCVTPHNNIEGVIGYFEEALTMDGGKKPLEKKLS